MLAFFQNEVDWEANEMDEKILQIIAEYMQEENMLSKEESQRFQKIWRKEG